MLRMSLTTGGLVLFLALPALAQGSMYGPSSGTTGSMPSAYTSAMTCDQIMERVKTMSISAPGATMALKQKEMIKARAARARNDEAGCKLHATKALQIIMYRT
ncbi:MAG TPA: hypothetical protein VKR31_04135 [Rhizomicrobium sp.]|nr:hypothetical protein [Rhizomicrobium sp.]